MGTKTVPVISKFQESLIDNKVASLGQYYESRIGTSYFLVLTSYFLVLTSYFRVVTLYREDWTDRQTDRQQQTNKQTDR